MKITKFFKRSRMGKIGIDRIKSPCSIYVASDDDFCQLMLFKNDDDTRVIVLMAPEELIALKKQIDHCAQRFLSKSASQRCAMEIIGLELDETRFVSHLTVRDTDGRQYGVKVEYADEERRFDIGTGPGDPFSDETMKRLNEFCDRVEGR